MPNGILPNVSRISIMMMMMMMMMMTILQSKLRAVINIQFDNLEC